MSKIVVDTQALSTFATTLSDKATAFNSLMDSMSSSAESVSGSWEGVDSQNFVTEVSANFNNFKEIGNAYNEVANVVIQCAQAYEQRCDDFYSSLG